jgi:DNA-binding MarR family transcriptional regulator
MLINASEDPAPDDGTADDDPLHDIVDLYGFTGRWLATAHAAMRAEFERRLSEAGGNRTTWRVLRAVDVSRPPSQIELARTLGITSSTLVRHLDRMVDGGLVVRQRERDDRRIYRVLITPAGRSLLHRLASAAVSSERALTALLPPEELVAMRHALRTIADHFGAANAHVSRGDIAV